MKHITTEDTDPGGPYNKNKAIKQLEELMPDR